MAFNAPTGALFDTSGNHLSDARNVRVSDGTGRELPRFSLEPSFEFAMADHAGPAPLVLHAAGLMLRVQLTDWGIDSDVPFAGGFVVG